MASAIAVSARFIRRSSQPPSNSDGLPGERRWQSTGAVIEVNDNYLQPDARASWGLSGWMRPSSQVGARNDGRH